MKEQPESFKIGELAGQMPMDSLFAECVFAGNALLSYHGHSPYEAVFGRTPSMLLDATFSVGTHLDLASIIGCGRLRLMP